MTDLGLFLRAACADSRPWNCSTLAADWCIAVGKPDFAAEWREIVGDAECADVPAAAGGLIALWDRGIGNALPCVSTLLPGDIAVVRLGEYEAGAIFTGERWAIRGPRCVHFIALQTVEPLKVWRP